MVIADNQKGLSLQQKVDALNIERKDRISDKEVMKDLGIGESHYRNRIRPRMPQHWKFGGKRYYDPIEYVRWRDGEFRR